LAEQDVVIVYRLINQLLRIGLGFECMLNGLGCGKLDNDVGVSPLQIPEIMQISVGEDHIPGTLGFGVAAGLFLSIQRVFALAFRLQHGYGVISAIKQKVVDEALFGFLKILAKFVKLGLGYLDVLLQLDVRFFAFGIEKPPACFFQQFVDLDAGGCFFVVHLSCVYPIT